MNQIFESAILDDIVFRNPTKGIQLPKYQCAEKKPLSEVEDHLSDVTGFSEREYAYILLIKWCGLRREEALALTIHDFNWQKETVSISKAISFNKSTTDIKDTKTPAAIREIPLINNISHFLKYYTSNLQSIYLFTTNDNRLITDQSFRRMWQSIIRKMNAKAIELGYEEVKGLTSHRFRHNYATILRDIGVDVKEAQYLLGHSSYVVTMNIYTQVDRNKLTVKDKLSNYISSQNVVN
ncbi:MAG: tyrosine-type recombinase/integrase [Coprobacillaceae bacterium]